MTTGKTIALTRLILVFVPISHLCLLIETLSPLLSKVSIDRYDLFSFCYLFPPCFCSSLFFFSSFHYFPCGLMILFSGMLMLLFFSSFCFSIFHIETKVSKKLNDFLKDPLVVIRSRDSIYGLRKVYLVNAMVFPVVMYRYESWTIKKGKH